jgi:hypothetical protein
VKRPSERVLFKTRQNLDVGEIAQTAIRYGDLRGLVARTGTSSGHFAGCNYNRRAVIEIASEYHQMRRLLTEEIE